MSHQPQSEGTEFRHRERSVNLNTLLIGALTVSVGVCGFFAKGIAEDVASTKTDVITIKAQFQYVQPQIDSLKETQQKLWAKFNGISDPPSTVVQPIKR